MSKEITVTMPLEEFERMKKDIDYWQSRFNTLKKLLLNHARKDNNGKYLIMSCTFSRACEDYLNDYEGDDF